MVPSAETEVGVAHDLHPARPRALPGQGRLGLGDRHDRADARAEPLRGLVERQAEASAVGLLEGVAARRVKDAGDAGAQGRDLLDRFHEEETLLIKPLSKIEPGHMVLVRGQERLLVQYSSDRPEIEALSFIDEAGYPCMPAGYSRNPPSVWIAAFQDRMARLSIGSGAAGCSTAGPSARKR